MRAFLTILITFIPCHQFFNTLRHEYQSWRVLVVNYGDLEMLPARGSGSNWLPRRLRAQEIPVRLWSNFDLVASKFYCSARFPRSSLCSRCVGKLPTFNVISGNIYLQCNSVSCSILRTCWLCNITVDTWYDCDFWKISLLWSSLGCAGCVLVPCWWLPSLAGWCWCPTKCLKLPRGASGQCIVDQEKIVVEFTSAHCRLTQQCIVKRLIENIKLCR